MGMKETIQSDLKEALKSSQQDKVEALRLLISSIKNAEIQNNKEPLTESKILDITNKQIKQYQETIQQLAEAGRKESAEIELAKMAYLKAYLPPQLSDEELNVIVSEVILSLKASGLSDQGPVIREVQKRVSGRADNVKVAQSVREQLQRL
ncbi:MAG: GatB/YqeY domain-containing protein [Bdellovibrionales bacterium]|nr:GatB/YqeY domain-containing protein [Bdellovibrionales bacterium]